MFDGYFTYIEDFIDGMKEVFPEIVILIDNN